MTFDLDRFRRAQTRDYEQALGELQAGRKRSHWIWYIFPQLAGLGSSPMAETYGLRGVEEAPKERVPAYEKVNPGGRVRSRLSPVG